MRHRRFIAVIACGVSSACGQPAARSLDSLLAEAVASIDEEGAVRAYRAAFVDLNADSITDALALMSDPLYCGSGGCTLLVFRGTSGGFELLSRSTVSREPIYVLSEATSGWKALAVHVAGGGVAAHQALLRFDGERYPLNPSTQPPVDEAALAAATQLEFQ